ncbi:MAG: SIS domain-containing protein [Planctomycetota bacterium]
MRASIDEALRVLTEFSSDEASVARIGEVSALCAERLREGGKILAVGNGGSCCDASHFCEELTGRFRDDRPPIAAIACSDPGHITCTANDYGFQHVFSRWVKGLATDRDVVFLLSTSGNSENMLLARDAANAAGAATVALLGKGGGALGGTCDHEWVVPGETSDRIQELHMLILHTVVEGIEKAL